MRTTESASCRSSHTRPTSPPFCCWSLHVRVLHTRGPSTRRSRGLTHKHAPPAQSLGTLHALLFAHRFAHSMPPQSTSVSFWSRLQLKHDRHVSHGPPHATQLTPPSAQFRHVSPASRTLFLHVAGIGREAFWAATKPLQQQAARRTRHRRHRTASTPARHKALSCARRRRSHDSM